MAGNKKPRKKYVPRKVLVDPLHHAIERVTPVVDQPSDWLVMRKLKLSSSLKALMSGTGTRMDMRELIKAHNTSYALVREGHAADHEWVCHASNLALQSLAERQSVKGVYIMNSDEIKAFQLLTEFFNELMDTVTVGQVEDALAKAREVMRSSTSITKLAPHFCLGEPK